MSYFMIHGEHGCKAGVCLLSLFTLCERTGVSGLSRVQDRRVSLEPEPQYDFLV